jgi:short-subunit dehydrogenase
MKTGQILGLTGMLLGGGGYWLWRYLAPQHSVLVLEEKVVIITGASSGIGRELALAFAKRGARVVLAARRQEQLEAVRHEIAPYATSVLVVPTDVAQESHLQALIKTVMEQYGRIDVLVNNAGVTHNGLLHEQDPQRVRRMVEVNLTAAIRLTQAVLPTMLLQREGYIVNIGSLASRIAAPLFSSYSATKAGLAGFSESLRRELVGSGIRVMLALPAWTRTEMLRAEWDAGLRYFQLPIQDADLVASHIVEGLVRGKTEIAFGGIGSKTALLLERHFPLAMDLYWRLVSRPRWQKVAQNVHSQESPPTSS